MSDYLDPNLYYEISEVLAKFYPYSIDDILTEIECYKSVDIVLKGIKLALERNISLNTACYLCYLESLSQ